MRLAGLWLAVALLAWEAVPAHGKDDPGPAITYPADGTVFPPEIVAPTVLWEDSADTGASWVVVARDSEGNELAREHTTETRWRPAAEQWTAIKERSVTRPVTLQVARERDQASSEIRLRTSLDPVGDSLFYREVPLPVTYTHLTLPTKRIV